MMFDPMTGLVAGNDNKHPDPWLDRLKGSVSRRFATGPEGMVQAIHQAMDGKIRSYGETTLAASTAATTLTDARIGPASVITFMPTTANAAAEIGNGTMYVSARTNGSATITHASGASTDRIFGYLVIGG